MLWYIGFLATAKISLSVFVCLLFAQQFYKCSKSKEEKME